MSDLVVVPPRAGEVIGDAPERRVEILSDHPSLHATWSRFGPGREGADLHVHREHTDCFYVLAGAFTLRLGTEDALVTLQAGSFARMPPMVAHGFRNASDAELRYLNLHAPGQRFADYLRSVRDGDPITYDQLDPPRDGVRPAADAVVGAREEVAPGITLLADVDHLAVAEVAGDATRPGAPHVHRRHTQSLYVLDGVVTLVADGGEHRLEEGAWAQVPPGLPHAVTFAERTRVLELHTPGSGYGSFLRALGDAGDEAEAAARARFDLDAAG